MPPLITTRYDFASSPNVLFQAGQFGSDTFSAMGEQTRAPGKEPQTIQHSARQFYAPLFAITIVVLIIQAVTAYRHAGLVDPTTPRGRAGSSATSPPPFSLTGAWRNLDAHALPVNPAQFKLEADGTFSQSPRSSTDTRQALDEARTVSGGTHPALGPDNSPAGQTALLPSALIASAELANARSAENRDWSTPIELGTGAAAPRLAGLELLSLVHDTETSSRHLNSPSEAMTDDPSLASLRKQTFAAQPATPSGSDQSDAEHTTQGSERSQSSKGSTSLPISGTAEESPPLPVRRPAWIEDMWKRMYQDANKTARPEAVTTVRRSQATSSRSTQTQAKQDPNELAAQRRDSPFHGVGHHSP